MGKREKRRGGLDQTAEGMRRNIRTQQKRNVTRSVGKREKKRGGLHETAEGMWRNMRTKQKRNVKRYMGNEEKGATNADIWKER